MLFINKWSFFYCSRNAQFLVCNSRSERNQVHDGTIDHQSLDIATIKESKGLCVNSCLHWSPFQSPHKICSGHLFHIRIWGAYLRTVLNILWIFNQCGTYSKTVLKIVVFEVLRGLSMLCKFDWARFSSVLRLLANLRGEEEEFIGFWNQQERNVLILSQRETTPCALRLSPASKLDASKFFFWCR